MKDFIKQELHQLVDICDDLSLLEEVKALLQAQDHPYDWWDKLSEEDKQLIQESEAQYERGEYITFQELMRKLR